MSFLWETDTVHELKVGYVSITSSYEHYIFSLLAVCVAHLIQQKSVKHVMVELCCVLPPHELPEEGKGQGSIAFIQVLSGYSHQREFGLFLSQLNGVVTVLQLQWHQSHKRHFEHEWLSSSTSRI